MRRWSPYNYAFNNPIRFIDPDGMAPIPVWMIRSIVVNVIKYEVNVVLGRQVSKLQRQIDSKTEALSNKQTEIYNIMNPPGPDRGVKFGGSKWGGAGGGAPFGEHMTKEDYAREKTLIESRFKERDPEGYEKVKELEGEIEKAKGEIEGLKSKQNKVMQLQSLIEQTNVDQIAKNIADGSYTVYEAVQESRKSIRKDAEKRQKEKDEKNP